MSDQPSPWLEAERAMLGAALLSRDALADVLEVVSPADCYEPRHETILATALRLHAAGRAVDALTVADEMGSDLAKAGGPAYLLGLAQAVPVAANAGYYAEIVAEAARSRRVRAALVRGLQAVDGGQDSLEVINAARVDLDALVVDESDDLPNELAVWAAIDSLKDPPGTPTAWPAVTSLIGGWRPGGLYVMGARPGVGKSVMGCGAVLDAARRGHGAALFAMEMSRDEMYLRLLSAVSGVPGGRIQHRTLTAADHDALDTAAKHIASLPLHIDDRSSLSVAQIRARVKALQRQRPVGLVVVDYLQLVRPSDPRADRRVQVDGIAQDLKIAARELEVPLLALAQVNRGSEQRADKMPQLSDLRESGGIEANADVVALLHRDMADAEKSSDLKVFFGKNRQGPTMTADLIFRGHLSRADDITT